MLLPYPVGEWKEADEGRDGRHNLYDHPDDLQGGLWDLHAEQPLLQGIWIRDVLQRQTNTHNKINPLTLRAREPEK